MAVANDNTRRAPSGASEGDLCDAFVCALGIIYLLAPWVLAAALVVAYFLSRSL